VQKKGGKGHWFNWTSVVRNYNLMRRKKLHMFNKLILVFFRNLEGNYAYPLLFIGIETYNLNFLSAWQSTI